MGVISDPIYGDQVRPLTFRPRGRVLYERPGKPGYEDREKARKIDAITTLAGFVRYMWPVMHPATPFVWGPHIDVVCWGLEQLAFGNIEGNTLVINIPPRHLKSEIVSRCFPAWLWLHAPHLSHLSLSTSDRVATKDTKGQRSLVQSERYKELIRFAADFLGPDGPGVWGITADQNQKTRFETDRNGIRVGLAAGADIIGEGADVMIVDDPIDSKDVLGAPDQIVVRMMETIERWGSVWESRLNQPKDSIRVVIMQRLHEMDLAGWLLKRGTPAIVLPTEFNPSHPYLCPYDWRTEPGELLFEERIGAFEVARMKGGGQRKDEDGESEGSWTPQSYAAQHGQLPSVQGGGMFPEALWREYDETPEVLLDRGRRSGRVICSWDLANVASARAKYTVVYSAVRFLLAPDMYLIKEYRDKLEAPGQTALFDRLEDTVKPHKQVIELAGNGITLCQTRRSPRICEIQPSDYGGKEQRATFTQNRQQNGTIWLPREKNYPWVTGLKQEHAAFPRGTYSDRVDALAQAVVYYDLIDPVTKMRGGGASQGGLGWLRELQGGADLSALRGLSGR